MERAEEEQARVERLADEEQARVERLADEEQARVERLADEEQARQARLSRVVDGLPIWKLTETMNDAVGFKRAAELMAWAVLWGLQGEASGSDLRRRLEAEGMTYASAYRALNDFRKVGDALLALPEYHGPGVFGSLRNVAAILAVI